MQENVNKYTKEIVLKGDEETWMKHSPNVVVGRKCIAFCNVEYHQRYYHYNNEEQGTISNERRSYYTHGVTPKLEKQREVLYEFFFKF